MKSSMLRSCLSLCCLLLLLSPGLAFADQSFAELALHTDGLVFQPTVEAAGFTLTVSTPDGLVVRKEFGPRETPSFSLADLRGGIPEGTYSYQLDMRPLLSPEQKSLMERVRRASEDARSAIERRLPAPVPAQSGFFSVYQGAIVQPSAERAEEAPPLANGQDWATSGGLQSAPEKTVISGDLTVYNSLCVGFDCLSAESYGSDSIRLKENNLRIHFDDTSVSPFPANDWRILANSTLSGGGSFLAFEDSTAARQVFTVEAGANTNSLYVDTGTRVGIGTGTPVLNLHVAVGNTPALRLEQNTSSGFAAQTWDIAGNETSFFIRDVTGGSQLPFRIFPGAASSSLIVAANSNIGIGTASPSNSLHLRRTDGTAQVRIEEASATAATRTMLSLINNGGLRININDNWTITATGGNLNFDSPAGAGGGPGNEAQMQPDGDFAITGNFISNGTILAVPDYVFETGYPLMEPAALRAFINEHKHLPNVPNSAVISAEGLNVSQFQMQLLEKIEELTLYTLKQEERLEQLSGLEQENAALQARLTELEAAVARLTP